MLLGPTTKCRVYGVHDLEIDDIRELHHSSDTTAASFLSIARALYGFVAPLHRCTTSHRGGHAPLCLQGCNSLASGTSGTKERPVGENRSSSKGSVHGASLQEPQSYNILLMTLRCAQVFGMCVVGIRRWRLNPCFSHITQMSIMCTSPTCHGSEVTLGNGDNRANDACWS